MKATAEIIYLNPRSIEPNRDNIRRENGDLVGLAETIREHGVLQPLGVVTQNGGYRVVYGDRRREAAILVGLDRVPCLLLGDLNGGERLVRNMLENLQRLDLTDMEKARAFDKMLDLLREAGMDRGAALDVMTRRLGLSASQIRRYLALLELAPGVQDLIGAGQLGVTQAQHLRQLAPEARQEEVARFAAEENLAAGEIARLATALARNPNIDPAAALSQLRRGETVSDLTAADRVPGGGHLPPPPPQTKDDEDGDDLGPEDGLDERPNVNGAPLTRDGNRVRKVHSLASFVDEADRLTRCVQEGDLIKLIEADPDGSVKVRLLAKQLGFLARAVAEIAERTGDSDRETESEA